MYDKVLDTVCNKSSVKVNLPRQHVVVTILYILLLSSEELFHIQYPVKTMQLSDYNLPVEIYYSNMKDIKNYYRVNLPLFAAIKSRVSGYMRS